MSAASYVFRAVDGLGVKHKGEIEADSAASVTELLKGRGLIEAECPDGHWIYRTVKLP